MNGVVFAGTIAKFQNSTREPGTWIMAINTQELDSDTVARIASLVNKYIKVYATDSNVLQPKIVEAVDEHDVDEPSKAKTKSQRLRRAIWKLWRNGDKAIPFQEYYDDVMERLIKAYLDKADS